MTAATQAAERLETNNRGESVVRRVRGMLARLPGDYPLAAIAAFVFFLAALVAVRSQLPAEALRDMHWLLAVAVVPILPWLLPLAAQHVSQLRAGPLELAFRDLDPDQITPSKMAIEDVAVALKDATVADMPTRSGEIVARVKEIEAERTEVVLVNLGGARLSLASLYFFAFLLESRTIVRRLVLEDSHGGGRRFVGMCSPRALRRSIEREHPLYKDVRKTTAIIDLDRSGELFFSALSREAASRGYDHRSPPPDATRIAHVLGQALEGHPIDGREMEGLPGLRRVLDSERRYIAVVDGDSSYRVLDQYRVALAIARRATGA